MSKVKNFTDDYKGKLVHQINKIDFKTIEEVIFELNNASKKKHKVYVIGNGGSAATASHIVNDFGAGLRRRRLLNLDICSLSDNSSTITALSNDIGYDNIYYEQLHGILRTNDLLIAISCSGNSNNIVKAVKYAKEVGAKIIGLTGFDGGELKLLSDINYHIETDKGEYGVVEDLHMIFDHLIYSYYTNI